MSREIPRRTAEPPQGPAGSDHPGGKAGNGAGPKGPAPLWFFSQSRGLQLHGHGLRTGLGGLFAGNQLLGKLVVRRQTRAGGDQLADDDVLLQAHQVVALALDGGLGQDLCGLLEGGGGQEGVCGQRGLGDTHQQLGAHGVAQGLAVLLPLAGGVAAVDLLVGVVQLQDVHHGAVQLSTPCWRYTRRTSWIR